MFIIILTGISKWSIKGICAVGDEVPAWDDTNNSVIEWFSVPIPNTTSTSESSSLDWQLSLAVWSVVSFFKNIYINIL